MSSTISFMFPGSLSNTFNVLVLEGSLLVDRGPINMLAILHFTHDWIKITIECVSKM